MTMNATRLVRPELLDVLGEDEPAARRSRRDLRIINRMLGTAEWFQRVLSARVGSEETVLEIGAGEGELGVRLMAKRTVRIAGLDLARRPSNWPEHAPWYQTSVFDFEHWTEHPVVMGNLVFHHFTDAQLALLGERLNRHARLIVVGEPLRSRRASRLFAMLCPLIGADPVTRHDGRVSIEAGFCGDELPGLLGLDRRVWSWRVEETFLGACRVVAERRP